jgi:hypothetical protein
MQEAFRSPPVTRIKNYTHTPAFDSDYRATDAIEPDCLLDRGTG